MEPPRFSAPHVLPVEWAQVSLTTQIARVRTLEERFKFILELTATLPHPRVRASPRKHLTGPAHTYASVHHSP